LKIFSQISLVLCLFFVKFKEYTENLGTLSLRGWTKLMRIYPAVDIKDGRAVRLVRGVASDATDYGDPVESALMWQNDGAEYLHIVDLDGAFTGESANLNAVKEILEAVDIPVQLGGGIRTMQNIEDRLKLGVDRVILGTVACTDPELVKNATSAFPDRIAVGIDVYNGKTAVKGWVEATEIDAVALALRMKEIGVSTVIYTDISRDGMLAGPNIQGIKEMVEQSGMDIIASGGVGSLEDIRRLSKIKLDGVIVGKALYSGAFTLPRAMVIIDN